MNKEQDWQYHKQNATKAREIQVKFSYFSNQFFLATRLTGWRRNLDSASTLHIYPKSLDILILWNKWSKLCSGDGNLAKKLGSTTTIRKGGGESKAWTQPSRSLSTLVFFRIIAKTDYRGRLQKKNVEFGLLAEIRRGRGLRAIQEPNLLSGNFFII